MPYRRKDSPIWWVSFTDPGGQRVRRSTGTTEKKEAKALEAKWRLETHQQQQWEAPPSHTFDELMVEYLKKVSIHKRSYHRDLCSAQHLKQSFGGRDLAALGAKDVRAYIEQRQQQTTHRKKPVVPATINRELSLLSAALNYARREWEWEVPNPVSGRKPKLPEGRVRWIRRAEAEALIRAAESQKLAPHLADFIRLAIHTGCRKGEMLGLECARVDLQEGLMYLEGRHTKTGKRRSVPLNAVARQTILGRLHFRATHCPDSPWVFAHKDGSRLYDIKKSFGTACASAGIADFRVHDLRHTCAAWLVSAGVPLAEVKDVLGHSTIKMTEKYAHLAPENARRAVAALEGGHVLVTLPSGEEKAARA
jgi:integrase